MKKLVFLGAMVMIVGGVALASSIAVPFFNDAGNLGWPPADGKQAAYIGLTNTTTGNIICYVTYTTDTGANMTPTNNTFLLPAKSAISWRPVADDPSIEGAGAAVPNFDLTKPNPAKFGSAKITWIGGEPTDIVGRVLQGKTPTLDTNAFTLPAGKAGE